MTALVVIPAVKVWHGRPDIGHGLPVLPEGELILVGPVEAFQEPGSSRLGDLTAHPAAILQTPLMKEVTGEIAAPTLLHQDGFMVPVSAQDSDRLVERQLGEVHRQTPDHPAGQHHPRRDVQHEVNPAHAIRERQPCRVNLHPSPFRPGLRCGNLW